MHCRRTRTSFSESPRHLLTILDADMLKNVVLHSVATAFASNVLPVPAVIHRVQKKTTTFVFLHNSIVFPHQTSLQYSDGNPPPNGGVKCRWGRHKSQFWANIWLHCVLWTVPAASAIHLAATDHGEFTTLVAGKRRSLLMAVNNDEVYDKKPHQSYAEDNVTQW